MKKLLEKIFKLEKHGTSITTEILAGIVGFFTVSYIIVVNASTLAEASIPYQGVAIATILISVIGCLIMGFYANAPLILIPGMGVNALFSYTIVISMGLSYEKAFAAVIISGLLFMILAFTPLARKLNESIPLVLKQATTVGLGLFLILIGLEKGGIVVKGAHSIISVGKFSDPFVLATLITTIVTIILEIRKVTGAYLFGILFGTGISFLLGVTGKVETSNLSILPFQDVFLKADFTGVTDLVFWNAVFTMTMVLVFETVGLTNGQVSVLKQEEKWGRILKASSITTFISGIFGTSPTVSALESGSMFASGAKTGLSTVTTAMLFAASFFLLPFIGFIPSSAIAPILIVIGISMLQEFKHMNLENPSEAFSALLIVVLIPFTYSIADGIAVGFITYPVFNLFSKKKKQLSFSMYAIAALFLLQFVMH
ncbi:NCS2 family permease [Clostridium sp. SHJSY1]|uniref:NCS2 family permease n=1 Tax=Clostridium sp. SHJSY1 TaxID=2942483 RepID=UPI002874CBF5|nr:NCS2 family permease [Clostridium sp. SHJSY1]MDS0525725.1 NCS2 family permease [Clostridium sp. SHJSY1]